MPNNSEKTAICKIWFCATASPRFSGKIFRIRVPLPGCAGMAAVAAAAVEEATPFARLG